VSSDRFVLVIDIGGTKLTAAIAGPGGGLTARQQVPTPRAADAEQLWQALAALTGRVLGAAGIGAAAATGGAAGPGSVAGTGGAARPGGAAGLAGVGVGCGGPMDWRTGLVSPLHIPAWRGFPLRARLQDQFPGIPVRLHNDAICVAAGEHWRGAGQGAGNVLGMTVSTGVGGGLILDGRVVEGGSGNAGHIGHVVVDPADGPPCRCGGRGCLEAIARGPALADWARSQGWRRGQPAATTKDLAADAARGDRVGLAAFARAGRALGIAIASATSLCDLEVVCIGGGLSQAGPLLFGPLEESLRAHARLEFTRSVRVLPAALGQDAGLVGAAALIFAADRYWAGA
jgi:glucokinase